MANEDIEQKIKLTYETNAEDTSKKVNDLSGNIDKVETAQNKAVKSSKAQSDAIKELAPATTSAIEGFKAMGKAMWTLVANPLGVVITALAVVVGTLYMAFKSFQPLVDKVEQSMAALGSVINVVKNTFIAVVTGTKSLGDAFNGLSGDMSEAASRTEKLIKAQQDLEDVMKSQEVTSAKNRAEINKLNVELRNRTLSEAKRLKIADKIEKKINLDYQQRKKNVDEEVRQAREAIAIKAQFSKEEIKLLKKTGDATKELAESRGGNYDAEYDRLNAARKAAIALEEEATVNTERLYNRRDKLEDDQAAKEEKRKADEKTRIEKSTAERQKAADAEKAIYDKKQQEISKQSEIARNEYEAAQKILSDAKKENEDALKTEQEKAIDDENVAYQLKLEAAKKANLDTEEIEIQHLNNINEINLKAQTDDFNNKKVAADKEIELAKSVAEQKKSIQEGEINLAENAVGFLSKIAGKNKTLQKAAIIAESALGIGKSIIATNASNVAATAEGAALAIPTAGASVATAAGLVTMNNISMGLGIAGNIAATSKALSALGGGGSASGGSQPAGGRSASTGASATPQVNFQASKENQISNTLAGKLNEQPPIRVTVLESDITKTQDTVQAKVVSNSF